MYRAALRRRLSISSSLSSARRSSTYEEKTRKSYLPTAIILLTPVALSVAAMNDDVHDLVKDNVLYPYTLEPLRKTLQMVPFPWLEKSVQLEHHRDHGLEPKLMETLTEAAFEEAVEESHRAAEEQYEILHVEEELIHESDSFHPEDASEPSTLDHISHHSEEAIAEIVVADIPTEIEASPATPSTPVTASVVTQAPTFVIPPVAAEHRSGRIHSDAAVSLMDQLVVESANLRKDLESSLLSDLHDLDEHALRTRVAQLTAEFFERTKWEGIRMHQALKQVESEMGRKYADMMVQQRAELEYEVNKVLNEQKQASLEENMKFVQDTLLKYEEKLASALREQSNAFDTKLSQELENNTQTVTARLQDELNHQVAILRQGHVEQMLQFQDRLEVVKADVQAFENVVDHLANFKEGSSQMHRENAALLALQGILTTSVPLGPVVDNIRSACQEDEVVTTVLDSLSSKVKEQGASTILDLRVRFEVVRNEVRKVALAPKDLPPLLGHMVGSLLASIAWAPKGYIHGDGVEETLTRASYLLDQGRLSEALKEVEAVDGYSRVLLQDWESAARDRLAADQALKILHARSILRNISFSF